MEDNFYKITGLMSGTSIDGIDISLIKTNGEKFFPIKNYFFRYNKQTKNLLNIILENGSKIINDYKEINRLDNFISKLHITALKKSNFLSNTDIIGFHGQTIYHNPKIRKSIQLGNPQMISNITKKTVVSDFRKQDLLNNGEGAPLAPIFHKAIIEKIKINLPSCFINIGGVSNLTFWDKKKLIGFDTGPGNVLLDKYCKIHLDIDYDDKGNIASNGNVNKEFLDEFIQNPFFKKKYPKSLDKLFFDHYYIKLLSLKLSPEDTLATMVYMIITSIKNSLSMLPEYPKSIIISGGGAKNSFLKNNLIRSINSEYINLSKFNLNADFIESQLIAYISARYIKKLNITFPSTTGTKSAISGGKIYRCS